MLTVACPSGRIVPIYEDYIPKLFLLTVKRCVFKCRDEPAREISSDADDGRR